WLNVSPVLGMMRHHSSGQGLALRRSTPHPGGFPMDVRWRYLIAVGFAGWLLPAAVVAQEAEPSPSAQAPVADSATAEPSASPAQESPVAVARPEATP